MGDRQRQAQRKKSGDGSEVRGCMQERVADVDRAEGKGEGEGEGEEEGVEKGEGMGGEGVERERV